MSVTLRPYQRDCLAAVDRARAKGVTRMLVVAATGTGKTTIFCELARSVAVRGERVLILAHRDELIDQAARRIREQVSGLKVGIEAGPVRSSDSDDVVIASVATVGRKGCPRLAGQSFRLLITDEAHHSAADSYGYVYDAFGVYEGLATHIGVTATPHRLDNKPLHGRSAIYEEVVFEYGIRKAIKDGYLCDIRAFRVETDLDLSKVKRTAGDYAVGQLERAVNTDGRNHLALEHWQRVAGDRLTIVFCAGIDHSHAVADLFSSVGIPSASVVGRTAKDIRRDAIQKFRSGDLRVLTNVNVLTEGFDAPETNCILLLRPTQSWSLYAQMVGRGLRAAPGKSDCAVIDVCDITTKHSLAHAPGLLGLPREAGSETLEGRELMGTLEALEAFSQGRPISPASRLISIQLLANMELPDYFERAEMDWTPAPGGRFSLSLADQGDRQGVRADIAIDAIGTVWLALRDRDGIFFKRRFVGDPADSIHAAERVVESQFPEAMRLVVRDAAWKSVEASEKQIAFLIASGLDPERARSITKGQATKMITMLLAASRRPQ